VDLEFNLNGLLRRARRDLIGHLLIVILGVSIKSVTLSEIAGIRWCSRLNDLGVLDPLCLAEVSVCDGC
jgi:hypothetical protein